MLTLSAATQQFDRQNEPACERSCCEVTVSLCSIAVTNPPALPAAPRPLTQRCQKQGFMAGKTCYQSSKQMGHVTSKAMSICPPKSHWQRTSKPTCCSSLHFGTSAPSRLLWGGGSWAHPASCASPAPLVTGPP